MNRKTKRNAYIAIMRASERGCGVRLTVDEVIEMSLDTGFAVAARESLTDEQKAAVDADQHAWARINPWREA